MTTTPDDLLSRPLTINETLPPSTGAPPTGLTPEQAVGTVPTKKVAPLRAFMPEIARLVLYPKIAAILTQGVVNKTDLHTKFLKATGSNVNYSTFWEWVELCGLHTVFEKPLYQLPTTLSGATLPPPPAGEPREAPDFQPGLFTPRPSHPTHFQQQSTMHFPPDPYDRRDETGAPLIA